MSPIPEDGASVLHELQGASAAGPLESWRLQFVGVSKNPCICPLMIPWPVIWPTSLIPVGNCNCQPEFDGIRSFRFCIPFSGLQINAINPDQPTTWPRLLMPNALPHS